MELIRNARLGAGAAGYHAPERDETTSAQEAQVFAVDPDGQASHVEQGKPEKGDKLKI